MKTGHFYFGLTKGKMVLVLNRHTVLSLINFFAGWDWIIRELQPSTHALEYRVVGRKGIIKRGIQEERPSATHRKIFYSFAYMNLVLIFSSVFIISLWRRR